MKIQTEFKEVTYKLELTEDEFVCIFGAICNCCINDIEEALRENMHDGKDYKKIAQNVHNIYFEMKEQIKNKLTDN